MDIGRDFQKQVGLLPASPHVWMETFISISEAARKIRMPEEELKALIESGKINAAMLDQNLLVKQRDIYQMIPRKEQPEYLKYAHLQGQGIGIREASRKYGVALFTIQRWIKRGLISIIGERTVRGGSQTMIDEADIAYCAEIRNQSPGRGHWLFRQNGTPRK